MNAPREICGITIFDPSFDIAPLLRDLPFTGTQSQNEELSQLIEKLLQPKHKYDEANNNRSRKPTLRNINYYGSPSIMEQRFPQLLQFIQHSLKYEEIHIPQTTIKYHETVYTKKNLKVRMPKPVGTLAEKAKVYVALKLAHLVLVKNKQWIHSKPWLNWKKHVEEIKIDDDDLVMMEASTNEETAVANVTIIDVQTVDINNIEPIKVDFDEKIKTEKE